MVNYLQRVSVDADKKIFIFGASELGNFLSRALGLIGMRIDGYFDNAWPDGGKNQYFEILPISRLEKLDKDLSHFIIGSYREKEIASQLRQLGFSHIHCQNELSMRRNEAYGKIRFACQEEPEVSVLVTACNGWDMTYNALKSLAENGNRCKFEVILGDDCSQDLTRRAQEYLENVKVIRHEENLQYLGNLNAIAKEARGSYLFLLANDVLFTQKNYMDVLLREMKKDSRMGMIAGKFWVPFKNKYDVHSVYVTCGRCAEVEPDRPRNVENMWPIATLMPRRVWTEMGGYDEAFLPAYYEDVDLEMRIMHAGYDLVAYPLVEAVHYGGGTYKWDGKDPLLIKNKNLFESRWGDYIENEKEKRLRYINAR